MIIRIRDSLKGFKPYSPPAVTAKIKLNTNESPIRPPESVLSAIEKVAREGALNRYPDPSGSELKTAIAELHGVGVENVALGNGSNEIIRHLTLAYGGEGRVALMFPPSYQVYSVAAKVAGCDIIEVPRDDTFSIGPAEIDMAKAHEPDIAFVCDPNNPTGTALGSIVVGRIADQLEGLIVVDEAYAEFSEGSSLGILSEHSNLAIVRTLSKAYGLAGLRVGYLISSTEIVRAVESVQLPYHLNMVSMAASSAALKSQNEYAEIIGNLIDERTTVIESLDRISGVSTIPTQSNFVMFRMNQDAGHVYRELLKREVLVRPYPDEPLFSKCLRVTVGTPAENKAFIEALEKVLAAF